MEGFVPEPEEWEKQIVELTDRLSVMSMDTGEGVDDERPGEDEEMRTVGASMESLKEEETYS